MVPLETILDLTGIELEEVFEIVIDLISVKLQSWSSGRLQIPSLNLAQGPVVGPVTTAAYRVYRAFIKN